MARRRAGGLIAQDLSERLFQSLDALLHDLQLVIALAEFKGR